MSDTRRFAESKRLTVTQADSTSGLAMIGLMRGDESALQGMEQADPRFAARIRIVDMRRTVSAATFLARESWAEENGVFLADFLPAFHGQTARLLFNAGERDKASVVLGKWEEGFRRIETKEPFLPLQALSNVDEALIALGSDELAATAFRVLSHYPNYVIPWGLSWPLPHLRGELARRLGHADVAEDAYERGLEWATRERVPVEAGRCLQGLAGMAEARGDVALALARLDGAAQLFQSQGPSCTSTRLSPQKSASRASPPTTCTRLSSQ